MRVLGQAPWKRAFGVLEQVLGPLQWHDSRTACANVEGRPVWLQSVSQSRQADSALRLSVPLAKEIPLALRFHTRHNTAGVGPEVRTGDPRFDEMYLVVGQPAAVIQPALDPQARELICSSFGTGAPWVLSLQSSSGALVTVRPFPTAGGEGLGIDQPLSAHEIIGKARCLSYLAERLVAEFDRQFAVIAQHQGEAAAQAWVAQQANALLQQTDQEDQHRRKLHLVIGLVVAAIFLLPMLWILLKVAL